MPKAELPGDSIDWRLTTWNGTRREELRRWAALPLEDVLRAIEEMQDFADALTVPSPPGTDSAKS
jgi:hypothetical protein